MTMRFIKQGILAVSLLISIQSVWAVCETELADAISKTADTKRANRVSVSWSEERARYEHKQISENPGGVTVDSLRRAIHASEANMTNARRSNFIEYFGIEARNSQIAYHTYQICMHKWRIGLIENRSLNSANAISTTNSNTNTPSIESQQLTQTSQQSAQQNQARADQQRQGKRKTNNEAAQAHSCIEIDKEPVLFGAFKNTCDYKVNFYTCNYKPKIKEGGFNFSADFDCEKNKLGLHTPDGGRSVAAHNRNTEMVYWFACKAPAGPVDAVFVLGKGIEARCY